MRLIDADAFELHVQNEWEQNNISNGEWMDIREWLRDAPTIDAVPVVRCKDCRWYGTYQLTKYGEYDKRYKPTVCIKGEYSIMRNEDWYCANGERKEDDDQ